MTGGMDNPVDVVFTPEGERIFSATFLVSAAAGATAWCTPFTAACMARSTACSTAIRAPAS